MTLLSTWISQCGRFTLYPRAYSQTKDQKWYDFFGKPNADGFLEYPLFAVLLGGKCGECSVHNVDEQFLDSGYILHLYIHDGTGGRMLNLGRHLL